VPLYFVSKLARDHVKVVLTGEGADELFLGYNRYRVTAWNARLGAPYWTSTPKSLRSGIQQLLRALPRSIRRYPERTFLGHEPGERALFFENFAVFPDRLQRGLLAARLLDGRDPYEVGLRCYREAQGGVLDRMSRADLQTYLQELLMKQDQMSMAASIESRVPFLDDELVEHVAAMPGRLKLRGWTTKAVLRAAVRDLVPKEILERKKMGFPVPLGRWLRGEFWPVVEEFVLGGRARERQIFDETAARRLAEEHRTGTADHGERLWLLINLEIWQRIFCEGEKPEDVMRPVGRKAGVYAGAVGHDGRPMAAEHRRPVAKLPYVVGAGAATSGGAGDDRGPS
jgi:asparagine synthase (glutamine-hydrolysing)